MSSKPQHNSFVVGQQMGRIGRLIRLTLGLLGLLYIGASFWQAGPSFALIGQLASGAVLAATLYIVIYWMLGKRVLSQLRPWLRTGVIWIPLAFIPFLFLIPWGWGYGVLLYVTVAMVVGALTSYGGCEVVVLPSLLFRQRYAVYCPLNAVDLIECQAWARVSQ